MNHFTSLQLKSVDPRLLQEAVHLCEVGVGSEKRVRCASRLCESVLWQMLQKWKEDLADGRSEEARQELAGGALQSNWPHVADTGRRLIWFVQPNDMGVTPVCRQRAWCSLLEMVSEAFPHDGA